MTCDDIEHFLHDVAEGRTAGRSKTPKGCGLARVTGGRTAATRAVGLLGGIFTYAVRRRICPDNPVRGVERFADRKRERRLSDKEYVALGEGLRKAKTAAIWPSAVGAGRFLAVTGWRTSEAMSLRWSEVDLARRTATLVETKTGRSIRPLSRVACDILSGLPRTAVDRVFPASQGNGQTILHFKKFWPRIAKLGGLPTDITPHCCATLSLHSLRILAIASRRSRPLSVTKGGRLQAATYIRPTQCCLPRRTHWPTARPS